MTEISLQWGRLSLLSLLGAGLAILVVALWPQRFEATVLFRVAELRVGDEVRKVEDPAQLSARLRLPTSYSSAVSEACLSGGDPVQLERLIERVHIRPMKGVPSGSELRVRAETASEANDCGVAIFGMIRTQQSALAQPALDLIRERLRSVDARILDAQRSLASGISRFDNMALYFALRDEVKVLREHKEQLEEELQFAAQNGVALIAPVHVPVHPWPNIPLWFAASIGAVFGFGCALAYQCRRRIGQAIRAAS